MSRHALLVSDVYFPRVNGVSTSLQTFCADLGEADVETTLVAPQYGPHEPADEGRAPRVLRVLSRAVPLDPEDRLMSWRGLNEQLAAVPTRPYDIVHIHTPFLAHYAGVRAARRLGVPVIATCHTWFEDYLHHYVPALPAATGRALARRVTRAQYAGLHAVIAPTPPLYDRLRGYGITTPIHVIPTGLPATAFEAGDGPAFRREHGIAADRPLLLILGRVAFEKNLAFLLRAFARVLAERPAALLLIAGEGPATLTLQREATRFGIGSAVRFIGNLSRGRALAGCYAAADAFVFASRTETQGLTLLEAMAQGVPVVSTACLGTRAVLAEGCGALVVPEEEAAFAEACVRLLGDRTLATRLSTLGIGWARRWSSRSMAFRLAELYAELIANARDAQERGDPATV